MVVLQRVSSYNISDLIMFSLKSVIEGCIPPAVLNDRLRASLQKRLDNKQVPLRRGDVQARSAIVVHRIHVVPRRNHSLNIINIALHARVQERREQLVELVFDRRARVNLPQVVDIRHIVEIVKLENLDKLLCKLNAAHAVAELVEAWGPDAEAAHARHDNHDAPAHAALGWQPNVERKLPTIVIHAARVHQRENVRSTL